MPLLYSLSLSLSLAFALQVAGMMNRATRLALNSQANPFNLRAISLFHSTPVLDRKRRTHWDSGGGAYKNTSRSWRNGFEESDSFSSEESPWSRREFGAKDSKRGSTSTKGSYSTSRSSFHFCDDDNDYETIFFRSAFGGNRFGGNRSLYWSFIEEDFHNRWQSSSGHQSNYRTSWNWRHGEDEDYDSSTESDSSETDLVSYRLVLGLSPSGPLKLDDVKNAYRTCALKWHPDRHQGSSKAVAEEKFKACSAAYESLCDKMALN
ncbi:hypothetical protein RHMOL_Rhmol03G0007100 [Rhododendron molle]|uniref:Uncharacterized protein n=1 Tax=Rhododendron molle TaxID=49168 RepID=A0ACC0P9H2_RHOML|nr:hypothetical protein RHMOL_Rhmol03G0007100 [Rhododendron molle]